MSSLEIVKVDKPFHIDKLPLDKVYVIDNYLEQSLHHFLNQQITNMPTWSKTNSVRGQSKTGLPHHQFWGSSFFTAKNGNMVEDIPKKYTYMAKYLNDKIQTDFGFAWERFQYMGLNSQTQGLHGTTHSDCSDEDEWNLSFLYYTNTFWSKHWGGPLRIYDEMQQGLHGRNDHIKNHQIAEIEFVPNRLVVFDGRIPHGADAPTPEARYIDRKSIVIRGDEIRLVEDKEWFKQCPQ